MTRSWLSRLWRGVGTLVALLAWPALFVYLRIGARTRVVIVAEDHVLLLQGWMSEPLWDLPGGGLHRHEKPEDGAVREVREETGVQLDPSSLQLLHSKWYSKNGLKFYCHVFIAELPKRVPLTKQRGEIIAAEWVPLTEVDKLPKKGLLTHALEQL